MEELGSKYTFKRGEVIYEEQDMRTGLKMVYNLEKITDMLLFLLEKHNLYFSYILINADSRDLETFLQQQKRETDLLFPIDKAKNVHVVIYQDATIDGPYQFAKRLLKKLDDVEPGVDARCAVLTVTSLKYDIRKIVFSLFDMYVTQKHDKTPESQITQNRI